MRMIGTLKKSESDDLIFSSSDGKSSLSFGFVGSGSLQIELNGEWLWLSPKEANQIADWIRQNCQE